MLYFTRQEKHALIFIISILLLGIGIHRVKIHHAPTIALFEKNAHFGKTNINTADQEALCALPGIGLIMAERIISYRRQYGTFKNIKELQKIPGITSYRYQKFKDRIYLE